MSRRDFLAKSGAAVAGAASVPTEVRFRVTGTAATSTQIQVGDVSAVTIVMQFFGT